MHLSFLLGVRQVVSEIARTSAGVFDVQLQQSTGTTAKDFQNPNDKSTDIRMGQSDGERKTTEEAMRKAVNIMNQLISPHHTSLHFAFHEKLDRYYVQIIDSDTNEVIKEIPPKKFLDAHAATLELLGFLVDKRI